MQINESYRIKYRVLNGQHGHPLAGALGRVKEHRKVLFDHIGPGWHPCNWCGKDVEWQNGQRPGGVNLVVDHLDGNRFNNVPENLVPSCQSCNAARNKRLTDGEPFIIGSNGQRHRVQKRACEVCGAMFQARLAYLNEGVGKLCSLRCASLRSKEVSDKTIREGELFLIRNNGVKERAAERRCVHCGNPFLVSVAALKAAKAGGRKAGQFCTKECYWSRRSQPH